LQLRRKHQTTHKIGCLQANLGATCRALCSCNPSFSAQFCRLIQLTLGANYSKHVHCELSTIGEAQMLVSLALHAASCSCPLSPAAAEAATTTSLQPWRCSEVHLKTRTYHVFLQLRMGWENDCNQCLEMSWLWKLPVEAEGGGY